MYSVSDDAEIGRIAADEKEITAPTIVCPMMGGGNDDMQKPTMRESECLQRLRSNKDCRNKCKAVDHLRTKYNLPIPEKKKLTPAEKKLFETALHIKRCQCGRYHHDVGRRGKCLACLYEAKVKEATAAAMKANAAKKKAIEQHKDAIKKIEEKQESYKKMFDLRTKGRKMLDTSRKEQ